MADPELNEGQILSVSISLSSCLLELERLSKKKPDGKPSFEDFRDAITRFADTLKIRGAIPETATKKFIGDTVDYYAKWSF